MSIRFNHTRNTITSTDSATIVIEGGTPTAPRPLRLDASSVVFPKKQLPNGEAGAVVFDVNSSILKYHNGFEWVSLLSQDDILAPVNISLTNIYNTLANRVSTVTYSTSSVPSASVSGTNLNIIFPNSTSGGGGTEVPGLFTSSPPGSIMHYSLISGQSAASIREQMSGVTGGQNGRNGTINAPYVTKTGWCFADGSYWTWNGDSGAVTRQVPNLNQDSYLKSMTISGITKTDSVVSASGSISNTTITESQHYHGVGMMLGLSGNVADDGIFIYGKTWNDGNSYNGVIITGDGGGGQRVAINGSDTRTALSTTYAIYPNGNTNTHGHTLSGVDVAHFTAAVLYNIAEPSLALNQSTGDARYVKKTGDTMTGSLTIANSATIQANDTSLALWFRNSSSAERAVIYHNSTNNTLRFRSSGGSEAFLTNTGVFNSTGLIVSGNSATVGSKNIVRSVNGTNADANGNVNITSGVEDVRLGTQVFYNPGGNEISWTFTAPAGCVLSGIVVQDVNDNSADNIGGVYYRPIQKLINGTWVTVGSL